MAIQGELGRKEKMKRTRKEGQQGWKGNRVTRHCQWLQQEQQEVSQTAAANPCWCLRNEALGAEAPQGLAAEDSQDLVLSPGLDGSDRPCTLGIGQGAYKKSKVLSSELVESWNSSLHHLPRSGFGSLSSLPCTHPRKNRQQLLTVEQSLSERMTQPRGQQKKIRSQEDGQPVKFPRRSAQGWREGRRQDSLAGAASAAALLSLLWHSAAKSLRLSNVHYAIVNDAITYHMFSSMAGFIQLIQMQDWTFRCSTRPWTHGAFELWEKAKAIAEKGKRYLLNKVNSINSYFVYFREHRSQCLHPVSVNYFQSRLQNLFLPYLKLCFMLLRRASRLFTQEWLHSVER